MPSAVADRLGELGADLWSMAQSLADGRLAGEQATLDAARAQLEAAKTDAADQVDPHTA